MGLALAAGFGLIGCNEQGGAPAPSTPTPASSLSVSFVGSAFGLVEGETADIPVRWSGAAGALRVGVLAQNQTTSDDDYELLSAGFEIPASSASGTAAVSLRALEDALFAEGDEIVSVRLVAPSGSAVEVGGSIEVRIEDAGVSPCAGIRISAEPPSLHNLWEEDATEQPSETAMTRFTVVSGPGSEAISLDWIGPYRDYDLRSWNPTFRRRNVNSSTLLHTVIAEWSLDADASTVRHEMDLEWLAELEIGLRFRSADGACTGEPVAACTGAGCELRR